MDSGNMTETLGETTQPDEVVVTESGATEATPQAEATEEAELYVDVEGDQQDEPKKMDERQLKAAWLEEKNKRKKKAEAVKAEKERADRLEQELDSLKSQVGEMSKGKRPSPYDFDSEEEFDKAYDAWKGQGSAEAKPARQDNPQQEQAFSLSDDQEYHLYDSENKLKKSLKDYDDVKARVEDGLKTAFNVPANYPIMDQIAAFAHTYDVDPAKAIYALEKMPSKVNDLVKSASNPAQIGRILRDLASKVKVRERKPLDTKPEPEIKGGGEVNAINQEINKAKEAYAENPTLDNHRKLQAVRKKKKKVN